MSRQEEEALVDALAEFAGEMGLEGVELDGLTIEAKPPNELPELSGHGDTLKPGDHFTVYCDGWGDQQDKRVYRLERIIHHKNEWDEYIGVLARPVDQTPEEAETTGPTSMRVEGPGWKRTFTKVRSE